MLSKTTEYALRAVTCLASQAACGNTPSSADEVAGITQIPRRYLHRVMQSLAHADLVESRCGSHGGYSLARPASAISILDVVESVEPLGRIFSCPLNLETHTSLCPLHAELDRAYAATQQAFGKVSIADLLNSTSPIVPLCDSL
ncbi:HTH-type transcriptional repressor NsrR [Rubripirellula lacrimiformis]|uniref:HTH-type transcriptional repressor NsrR n=1 Tax=Rubripirellula lacrimiformis TaxID=1930273 RepID=A0A517ND45_9BACT|nr:Rrf2 family transcriptional regulator [Rubripirellula lacrimiformis]QDT05031.1 HTH-type transcriptional repressor NsrR [Rubripirellula lacrimiformis]